jgi:hypothetical protein
MVISSRTNKKARTMNLSGTLAFGPTENRLEVSVTDCYCAESVETAAFHFQFSYLSRLCRIWVYRFRLVQLR